MEKRLTTEASEAPLKCACGHPRTSHPNLSADRPCVTRECPCVRFEPVRDVLLLVCVTVHEASSEDATIGEAALAITERLSDVEWPATIRKVVVGQLPNMKNVIADAIETVLPGVKVAR